MLFRIIKNNLVANYFLIPLLAAGIWVLQLLDPIEFSFYEGENQMVLFAPFELLLGDMPLISTLTGLLMIILAAVLSQRISVEFGFFRMRTSLPAFIFILLASGFRELHLLHPVHFALVFLLLAIYRLFSAFDQRNPFSQCFDANFILAVGSMFYFNLIVLLPAFTIAGSILGRESRWREIFISLLGFLLPWIFVFSGYFLFDQLPELLKTLQLNTLTENNRITSDNPVLYFLGYLVILTISGSYFIMRQYDEKKVSIRQYFKVFFLIFGSAVLSVFLVPAASTEALLIATVPLTFLISNQLLSLKRYIWGEIIILLLVAFNVVLLFA
jgi:hypothetical protein